MTIRDKVREIYPADVGECYYGGVKGCPRDYSGLEEYDCCANGEERGCEKCWSQEYQETQKPQPKKKLNWSVGFLGGAALEALCAGVDLFRGNWAQFRFCCVMGLLYLIAAGVWRDRG